MLVVLVLRLIEDIPGEWSRLRDQYEMDDFAKHTGRTGVESLGLPPA